jgi:hypothetical protein
MTRLASNEIFLPSNKIHHQVGRAKDLSATPVASGGPWNMHVTGFKIRTAKKNLIGIIKSVTVEYTRQHPRDSEHISPPNSPEESQLQPELNTIGSNTQPDLLSWWWV